MCVPGQLGARLQAGGISDPGMLRTGISSPTFPVPRTQAGLRKVHVCLGRSAVVLCPFACLGNGTRPGHICILYQDRRWGVA